MTLTELWETRLMNEDVEEIQGLRAALIRCVEQMECEYFDLLGDDRAGACGTKGCLRCEVMITLYPDISVWNRGLEDED